MSYSHEPRASPYPQTEEPSTYPFQYYYPIYAEGEDEPHVENLVQIGLQGWNGEQRAYRAYSSMERSK
jgi:hypothetical protein